MMKNCFVISPIGKEGSATRQRADEVLLSVIRPVCLDLGFSALRADELAGSGLITKDMLIRLLTDDLVVADLTEHNPNVFYELAVRHFTGKPLVSIISHSELIPFDVFDVRTIRLNHDDPESIKRAKTQLRKYIEHSQTIGTTDNPILDAIRASGYRPELRNMSTVDMARQFEEFAGRLATDLEDMRKERSLLIDRLVGQTGDSRPAGRTAGTKVPRLRGVWRTTTPATEDELHLAQYETDAFGQYQWQTSDYVGELVGKVIHGRLIYRWSHRQRPSNGVGYFEIQDNDLKGAWWDLVHTGNYLEYLGNPDRINELPVTEENTWCLKRVSD